MRKRVVIMVMGALVAGSLMLGGCGEDTSPQDQERKTNQQNYEDQVNKQPADTMEYSPTREGVNKWIDRWDEPGKLSYVYMVNADGEITGYYILEGLPISYCASLTPTEKVEWDYEGNVVVKNPSMDGVYYSGGQCNQYYGFDASTGAYIEFSIGGSQNYYLLDQPLPRQDIEALGLTTVEDVK